MQTPGILAANDAVAILQNLFNLGEFWTKNYVHPYPQRSVAPHETLSILWPSHDRIVFYRQGQQWPASPHIDWEQEHGGLLPRIELRNVQGKGYSQFNIGDAEPVGPHNQSVALSQRYSLIPGEIARWNLDTAASNTKAFTDAVQTAIEASSKSRFGSFDFPVGQELGLEIKNQVSNSKTETELATVSFSGGGEYKNETSAPITIERTGFRTMREEVRLVQVLADFEYEVLYFPLQRGNDYYFWATKGEFARCMRGEEPESVGAYSAGGKDSFGKRARALPNPDFEFDPNPYRIWQRVQYNRAIHEEFETAVVS